MKKTAIVTGARKGLGLAWCKVLVQHDYRVYLTARSIDQAEKAANSIEGEVIPMALDVTKEESIRDAFTSFSKAESQLDLLVNNAGVNPKDYSDKEQMEGAFYLDKLLAEPMLQTIHANSISPLLMMKHFRAMLKNAEMGKVINISSWLGSVNTIEWGYHFGYCGSKNLLNMLNKMAAIDLKEDRIVSVCVNPGWVQTDMGGSKAEFTPEQSALNIFNHVVAKIQLSDAGKFLNHDGQDHPW